MEENNIVLLHTAPPSYSQQPLFTRQYNSCVDFTFLPEQSEQNACRLKQANSIFERAADPKALGIRGDKLVQILPKGSHSKFGLPEPANEKDIVSDAIYSRGKFLATFANESSTFLQTVAFNNMRDRKKKRDALVKAALAARPEPTHRKRHTTLPAEFTFDEFPSKQELEKRKKKVKKRSPKEMKLIREKVEKEGFAGIHSDNCFASGIAGVLRMIFRPRGGVIVPVP